MEWLGADIADELASSAEVAEPRNRKQPNKKNGIKVPGQEQRVHPVFRTCYLVNYLTSLLNA
jgi:hypothetical protein